MAGRALASLLIRSSRLCLRSACHLQKPLQVSALNQFSRSPSCVIQTASIQTTSLRFNENIINIQDPDDFKTRVLESDKPVIVDFHASWCGPCKMLGPRLEAMSAVGEGSVILAKVDIDELQDVAIEFGVEAVPTVYAMKGGKVQDKFVGVKDDDSLQAFADKLLVK